MRLFLKVVTVLVCFGLGATTVTAEKKNVAKEEGKKDKKEKDDKEKKDDKKDTLSLPIPKDRPQKGVKIPLYNAEGKLRMHFTIGVATWVSVEHIKMETLSIQTYKEDGEMELDMEFPDAMMNVKTKEIATDTNVTIRRDDFEISGKKLVYNTDTKIGKLSNGVKMLIYNTDGKSDAGKGKGDAKKKLSVEVEPKPSEKKP